jgi:hypothetical protein
MKILYNAIKTPDGTILESTHVHDFCYHLDKVSGEGYLNDGGCEYVRRSVNKVPYEDLTVYDDGKFTTQRKYVRWGRNYDENNTRLKETEWIPIKDLKIDHIYAILKHKNILVTRAGSIERLLEEEVLYRENIIQTKELYCNNVKSKKV